MATFKPEIKPRRVDEIMHTVSEYRTKQRAKFTPEHRPAPRQIIVAGPHDAWAMGRNDGARGVRPRPGQFVDAWARDAYRTGYDDGVTESDTGRCVECGVPFNDAHECECP